MRALRSWPTLGAGMGWGWFPALLCVLLALPRPAGGVCREPPAVWMGEATAASHLLAWRDALLPAGTAHLGLRRMVVLRVTVDRQGKICEVSPVAGRRALIDTAVRTVKKHWRYRRFLVDGRPAVVQFPFTLRFVLPPEDRRIFVRLAAFPEALARGVESPQSKAKS